MHKTTIIPIVQDSVFVDLNMLAIILVPHYKGFIISMLPVALGEYRNEKCIIVTHISSQ